MPKFMPHVPGAPLTLAAQGHSAQQRLWHSMAARLAATAAALEQMRTDGHREKVRLEAHLEKLERFESRVNFHDGESSLEWCGRTTHLVPNLLAGSNNRLQGGVEFNL